MTVKRVPPKNPIEENIIISIRDVLSTEIGPDYGY
jgi:hypothetical protein